MKKTNKKFTLVELLCAVGLVVILAGIGFSAYSYASHRGKEAATKSLIARIGAGLETLKTKHGSYPSCSSSYGDIAVRENNGIIDRITFGSTAITDSRQLKDFLAAADGESLKKYVSNGYLTDAWGGKIKYRYPGSINTVKFDLVAPGADEGFGTGAATAPPAGLSDYKSGDEWACDDIANFK